MFCYIKAFFGSRGSLVYLTPIFSNRVQKCTNCKSVDFSRFGLPMFQVHFFLQKENCNGCVAVLQGLLLMDK